jgi:hypothetical protein
LAKALKRITMGIERGHGGVAGSTGIAVLIAFLAVAPHVSVGPLFPAPYKTDQADEIHQLWSANVDPPLRARIQSSDQAYTIGQELIVPLHAAFRLRDDAWERSFSNHFSRLVSDPSVLPTVVLSRLEYLYLASQFVVLARENERQDLIPPGLPEMLFAEVSKYWRTESAWQWGQNPFPGGIRERILWKLSHRKTGKSYYRAMVDDDLFLLAMAADLKAYRGTPEQMQRWSSTLDEILAIAFKVYSEEGVFRPGGGWLFQPGVWADHPEYQYVGNLAIHPGMSPAPVRGIAADSSHSMRFAAWLTSFVQAYPPGSDTQRFYAGLREGLEKQFFEKVLIQPSGDRPCYLLNNFMDGSNGVYRWNYSSVGSGNGYGPYELSGSFLLGWWSLLDTQRIREVYAESAKKFPWPHECLDFYLGPATTGSHPTASYDPQSPTMRLWHTLVMLASEH